MEIVSEIRQPHVKYVCPSSYDNEHNKNNYRISSNNPAISFCLIDELTGGGAFIGRNKVIVLCVVAEH